MLNSEAINDHPRVGASGNWHQQEGREVLVRATNIEGKENNTAHTQASAVPVCWLGICALLYKVVQINTSQLFVVLYNHLVLSLTYQPVLSPHICTYKYLNTGNESTQDVHVQCRRNWQREKKTERGRDVEMYTRFNADTHQQCMYTCGHTWNSLLITFNAPFTRPGNITVTKHLAGNVHTVLMIPNLAHITLGHYVTFLLRQMTGAVELHCLGVPHTCTPFAHLLLGSMKGDTAPSNWPGAVWLTGYQTLLCTGRYHCRYRKQTLRQEHHSQIHYFASQYPSSWLPAVTQD